MLDIDHCVNINPVIQQFLNILVVFGVRLPSALVSYRGQSRGNLKGIPRDYNGKRAGQAGTNASLSYTPKYTKFRKNLVTSTCPFQKS